VKIISKEKAGRAGKALHWPGRIMELTRVLGRILFLVLLFNAVQASGTTVPAGQSVTLAWNPSPDTNVTGYNVYYGVASDTYTNMINAGDVTNVTIYGLVAGVTYYFAATAYDDLGQESAYSGEVSYSVPEGLPTVQLRSEAAGQFILTVTGQIGHTYEIQATQDFTNWTVIGMATLGVNGSLDFTDTNSQNFPERFYRTLDTQP
jgi:hypothetical protein